MSELILLAMLESERRVAVIGGAVGVILGIIIMLSKRNQKQE